MDHMSIREEATIELSRIQREALARTEERKDTDELDIEELKAERFIGWKRGWDSP